MATSRARLSRREGERAEREAKRLAGLAHRKAVERQDARGSRELTGDERRNRVYRLTRELDETYVAKTRAQRVAYDAPGGPVDPASGIGDQAYVVPGWYGTGMAE